MGGDRPAILGGTPVFRVEVPILRPFVPSLDAMTAELREVLASGQITNAGKVKEFEQAAARYLGVEHCVAVSSCTSGLLLTLRGLGVRGEVILPSFTFFASAHAVVWNGLAPVFVDCEPDTFNIDPLRVQEGIGPRTGAILGVHMYGNPSEVEALQRLARQHRIHLVFDAAHGFGSKYQGKPVGGFGEAEVFSLSPTKTVIAGEGGVVATNDGKLAERLRAGRNYGDAGDYDPELVGLNARMSELHAVMALHSIRRVEEDVTRRNAIAERYEARLGKLPGLAFQKIRAGNRSTCKDFSFLVDERAFGIGRDDLRLALNAEGMMTRKYFDPPVHRQKAYREYLPRCEGRLPNTERISSSVVSLPIYYGLSDAQVDDICSAVERIWRHADEVRARVGSSA